MKSNIDIYLDFLKEYAKGNITDIGYDNIRGRKVIVLHNVAFKVDDNVIVPNSLPYEDMVDMKWYDDNYLPIVDNQYDIVISKLKSNQKTRQAIFFYGSQEEHNNEHMICTMYVYCGIENGRLQYSVHMRSNDAIEFNTDVKFHESIVYRILKDLNMDKDKYDIMWFVDNMHLYINEDISEKLSRFFEIYI